MTRACSLSDSDLLARLPALVHTERHAAAEVIAHLAEIGRRRLFLGQACSSLYTYCIERLGYAEDAALKRVRVARLAERVPRVLDELRSGAIHLTGLFLLSQHLNDDNADTLLDEARHRSKREIERLIASWFPRPDVPERIVPVASGNGASTSRDEATAALPFDPTSGPAVACSGAGSSESRGRLEPLSAATYRVELTVSAELRDKIERARSLVSHSVPDGELSAVLERALDALIERETKRRMGAGHPRKQRATRPGSRHVPVAVARRVWERDGAQCAFQDSEGRRCAERRFLTIEHRQPFALGGPPTVDNLCLLCSSHNQGAAREVFGGAAVRPRSAANRRTLRDAPEPVHPTQHGSVAARVDSDSAESDPLHERDKVLSALCNLGFRRRQAALAVEQAAATASGLGLQAMLRTALGVLVPG